MNVSGCFACKLNTTSLITVQNLEYTHFLVIFTTGDRIVQGKAKGKNNGCRICSVRYVDQIKIFE